MEEKNKIDISLLLSDKFYQECKDNQNMLIFLKQTYPDYTKGILFENFLSLTKEFRQLKENNFNNTDIDVVFHMDVKADHVMKLMHSLVHEFYKDNIISKAQLFSFIEEYHGKTSTQMLSDFNDMKDSILSARKLEKVGYVKLF